MNHKRTIIKTLLFLIVTEPQSSTSATYEYEYEYEYADMSSSQPPPNSRDMLVLSDQKRAPEDELDLADKLGRKPHSSVPKKTDTSFYPFVSEDSVADKHIQRSATPSTETDSQISSTFPSLNSISSQISTSESNELSSTEEPSSGPSPTSEIQTAKDAYNSGNQVQVSSTTFQMSTVPVSYISTWTHSSNSDPTIQTATLLQTIDSEGSTFWSTPPPADLDSQNSNAFMNSTSTQIPTSDSNELSSTEEPSPGSSSRSKIQTPKDAYNSGNQARVSSTTSLVSPVLLLHTSTSTHSNIDPTTETTTFSQTINSEGGSTLSLELVKSEENDRRGSRKPLQLSTSGFETTTPSPTEVTATTSETGREVSFGDLSASSSPSTVTVPGAATATVETLEAQTKPSRTGGDVGGYGAPPPPATPPPVPPPVDETVLENSGKAQSYGKTNISPPSAAPTSTPEETTTLSTDSAVEMVSASVPPVEPNVVTSAPSVNAYEAKKPEDLHGFKSADGALAAQNQIDGLQKGHPTGNMPGFVPNVIPNIPVSLNRAPKPLTPTVACFDEETYCDTWAKSGLCFKNSAWMMIHCQKSCDCCGCTMEDLFNAPFNDRKLACDDRMDLCSDWAKRGGCENNAGMKYYCRASCRIC